MKKQKKQNLLFALLLCIAVASANWIHCEKSTLRFTTLSDIIKTVDCQAEEIDTCGNREYLPTRIPDPIGEELTEEQILDLLRRKN